MNRIRKSSGWVLLLAATVSTLVVGCGESDDDSNGTENTSASLGKNDLTIGGDASGATANTCQTAVDCKDEQLCHPAANLCVEDNGDCESSTECPAGNYCDEGACITGLAGSPCDGDSTCAAGTSCAGNVCACSGFQREQESLGGPLDIYFLFDRTGSMGDDCDYDYGQSPPVGSKACYATYAMSDYLIDVSPAVDTRLAFQFMSYPDSCDGQNYSTPLVGLTELPLPSDHEIITEISNENFEGGSGTQIEGALKGIAHYTANNQTPGREMIGVLMTDGDPTEHCSQDTSELAQIISDHRDATGLRTFIIGMQGATEQNLETLAIAGGAEPHDDFCGGLEAPCHYWNVGDGSGEVLASALAAIAGQASPLPCEYALSEVRPGDDQNLDLSTLNVQLSQPSGTSIIVNVPDAKSCPDDQEAWHYDSTSSPSEIVLCPRTCDLATAADAGARMTIVGGCSETVVIPEVR